jgi:tetratricopeptide (TPR) repeat protein
MEWRDAVGDSLTMSVEKRPPEAASHITDLESLRTQYRQEFSINGGGIVSVETVRAGRVLAVKVIAKYERIPAYDYEGAITVHSRDLCLSITVRALERGTTGTRDAAVGAHLAGLGELEIEPDEGGACERIKGWFQDPYDPGYRGRSLYSVSDDERLDGLFPNHPLSKVRACLARIQDTLSIEDRLFTDVIVGLPEPSESHGPRGLMPPAAIGVMYLEVGRYDLAETYLADVTSTSDAVSGKTGLKMAHRFQLMGLAQDCQGKHVDAERSLSRACDLFEAALGEHPVTALARINLARVYTAQHKYAEAAALFEKALAFLEEQNPNGTDAAIALNGLGLVRNAHRQFAEAVPYLERALEIFERNHGPDFTDCGSVLQNLGHSFKGIGDSRRAAEAFARAERIASRQRSK